MSKYTVDALSLSHIGDLLRDRLGSSASQYLFPDDFEKAVVDIGFTGLVIDGDSSPYDEIIFIGNVADKMIRAGSTSIGTSGQFNRYREATFIGTTNIPGACLAIQTDLTTVNFCNGITYIGSSAFYNCTSLGAIVLPSSVTSFGERVFATSGITSFSGEGITQITSPTSNGNGIFSSCSNLKSVYLPKCLNYPGGSGRGQFYNCTGLETVQLGSVGYGLPSPGTGTTYGVNQNTFAGCTSSFTLTMYAEGSNVDALVTAARSGATNATIVVKASVDTTYGGTSYSAGDTIKTSTP